MHVQKPKPVNDANEGEIKVSVRTFRRQKHNKNHINSTTSKWGNLMSCKTYTRKKKHINLQAYG